MGGSWGLGRTLHVTWRSRNIVRDSDPAGLPQCLLIAQGLPPCSGAWGLRGPRCGGKGSLTPHSGPFLPQPLPPGGARALGAGA